MADTEVTISGTSGDTEIDLYADVVENELETVWKYLFNKTTKDLLFIFFF